MKKRPTQNERAKQRLALSYLAHHAKKAKKAHAALHITTAVASLVLIALIGTWVGGNVFATRFTMQNKTVAANTADATLVQMLQDQARTYHLTIAQPDGKQQSYSFQDIGVQIDPEKGLAMARQQQHSWLNRLQWWRPIPLTLSVTTDQKALDNFVAQHATIMINPAQDASLTLVDGTAKVSEEVAGKQYGLESPAKTIMDAIRTMRSQPLQMHIVAGQPAVTAQSLAHSKAKLEAILHQQVIFTIDDQQVKPSATDIAGWVAIAPGQRDKDVTISVNADAVRAYVNKIAGTYTHPARAQVSNGNDVIIEGANGVAVADKDSAVDAVTKQLLEAKNVKATLPVKSTPYKTITASADGKWLEVDLTNKRMYAYQGTDLVRTFLVSAGAPKTPTVTGTFSIYSKTPKKTMSGPNADGTRYVQPNVPWVNFFYRDYAIHGNYWRPRSYFGNVNSSHGCVGVTPGEGAWIYNWAPVGTTVVIHT